MTETPLLVVTAEGQRRQAFPNLSIRGTMVLPDTCAPPVWWNTHEVECYEDLRIIEKIEPMIVEESDPWGVYAMIASDAWVEDLFI